MFCVEILFPTGNNIEYVFVSWQGFKEPTTPQVPIHVYSLIYINLYNICLLYLTLKVYVKRYDCDTMHARNLLQSNPGHMLKTETGSFHGAGGTDTFSGLDGVRTVVGLNGRFWAVWSWWTLFLGEVKQSVELSTVNVFTKIMGSINGINSSWRPLNFGDALYLAVGILTFLYYRNYDLIWIFQQGYF